MHVIAQHPVPVRWSPARGRDRITYLAARTPVEIPEISLAELERDQRSYDLGGGRVGAFLVYRDRYWEPAFLKRYTMAGDRPGTAAELADVLSERAALPHGIASPGTPLCGARVGPSEIGLHGEALTARVLARAQADHGPAVRAAFKAWAEESLLVASGKAYVARGMPVYAMGAPDGNPAIHRAPADWKPVPVFEAARMDGYAAYMHALRLVERGDRPSEAFVAACAGLPDTRSDLALFANAAPRVVEAIHARALAKANAADGDLAAADPYLARLRPLADLGRVRAVPEERWGEVADLVSGMLAAIAGALPTRYAPQALRQMRAYVDRVARPALAAHAPADDLDSLSGLAPAP